MKSGKLFRPFSESAKIYCKSYSTPLQRAIVDFASDVSFAESANKLKEHYGIEVPTSSIRSIAEMHAETINKNLTKIQKKRPSVQAKKPLIMQSDGGMVPIVKTQGDSSIDNRKTRQVGWKENRLSLVYAQGNISPIYASTMGSVDDVGNQFIYIADLAGRDDKSHIHFVADGAQWIADQVDTKFGAQANFLLDFYHLSEYLHKAGHCLSPEDPEAWASVHKKYMKEGKINTVIQELERHINEDKKAKDHVCEAKNCYNYMIKRLQQFNYKDAIAKNLPIGSGKIESGHRSVIQKRLKISGAWWLEKNVESMASLRVLRANGFYDQYWASRKMSELSCAN